MENRIECLHTLDNVLALQRERVVFRMKQKKNIFSRCLITQTETCVKHRVVAYASPGLMVCQHSRVTAQPESCSPNSSIAGISNKSATGVVWRARQRDYGKQNRKRIVYASLDMLECICVASVSRRACIGSTTIAFSVCNRLCLPN